MNFPFSFPFSFLSADPENLTMWGPDGLRTTVHFRPGTLAVTGSGTADDPFVLGAGDAAGAGTGAGVAARAGDAPVRVAGDGSVGNPLIVGLNAQPGLTPGVYAGFHVDQFGLITRYDAAAAPTPTGGAGGGSLPLVTGSGDIQALPSGAGTEGTNYTLSLLASGVEAGTYAFGRFRVTVDAKGRVTGIAAVGGPVEAGRFYAPADPTDASIPARVISYGADGAILGVT